MEPPPPNVQQHQSKFGDNPPPDSVPGRKPASSQSYQKTSTSPTTNGVGYSNVNYDNMYPLPNQSQDITVKAVEDPFNTIGYYEVQLPADWGRFRIMAEEHIRTEADKGSNNFNVRFRINEAQAMNEAKEAMQSLQYNHQWAKGPNEEQVDWADYSYHPDVQYDTGSSSSSTGVEQCEPAVQEMMKQRQDYLDRHRL